MNAATRGACNYLFILRCNLGQKGYRKSVTFLTAVLKALQYPV